VFSRILSQRLAPNGEYIVANNGEAVVSDGFELSSANELELSRMSLPPRYRFRDLLLGDFAFRDDGER
jgi:hypothetical protein